MKQKLEGLNNNFPKAAEKHTIPSVDAENVNILNSFQSTTCPNNVFVSIKYL